MMKKILLSLIAIPVFYGLMIVYTNGMQAKGPSEPAGNSNKGHLYLYEKDPSSWEIVPEGKWGKMTYDLTGDMFDYVFNAHQMVVGNDYTLVYYPDPWPGKGLMCLGSGVANEYGDVHIKNAVATGDLPTGFDTNLGAKIWLVETLDVQCEGGAWSMVGSWKWNVLNTYNHEVEITSQDADGYFTGTGTYPYGAATPTYTEVITGQVVGDQVAMTTVYTPGGYTATAIGTIAPDGTVSGSSPWNWEMTEGTATSIGGKMVGWSPTEYLFEEALINFTFMP